MNIAVHKQQRRKGIARLLIEKMLRRTEWPNAKLTLEVRPSNHAAIHLYRSLGFVAVGIRKRYYQDTGEDALVMWLSPGTNSGSFHDIPNADPALYLKKNSF